MTNYVCLLHKFVEVLYEQTSAHVAQQIQYQHKGKINFLPVNETEKNH